EIPRTIPSWLWGGHVTFNKHSTLKLKFLDPNMIEQSEQLNTDVDDNIGGKWLRLFKRELSKLIKFIFILLESLPKIVPNDEKDEEAIEVDTEVSITLEALALEVRSRQ